MKKPVKILSLLLAAALLLCSLSIPASAVEVRNLIAAYSGIHIVLDGQVTTPRDAKGKIVQPFTLGGTTYLPIRAVANSLNLGVAWDQATKTVTLDSSHPDPKPDPDKSGVAYANFEAFGGTVCTLYFPSGWKGSVKIDNNKSLGSIRISDANNSAYGGHLFTLRLFSDNSYKELPNKTLLYDILYQGKTYHLVRILPTDVQWGDRGEASYAAKRNQIDSIVENLVFSPASRPARAITRTLRASYPGVKIILDGKNITPKDVNGKVVEPFIVGGTTYLPLRAIASSLGLGVNWDQATKTVTLTSSGSQEPTPEPTPGPAEEGAIAYRGVAVADLLGISPDSAYGIFGSPDYGTEVNGNLYEGGEYFAYLDGAYFIIDSETGLVSTAFGKPEAFTVNGTGLDTTREGIIALLGNPVEEHDSYDVVQATSWHYMEYELDGMKVRFRMPDRYREPNLILMYTANR